MLPELEAERQLLAIEAASVPHMTQQARLSVLDRWGRRGRKEQPASAGAALASLPIPIVKHPVKKRRR
jgi:hypothetical protein